MGFLAKVRGRLTYNSGIYWLPEQAVLSGLSRLYEYLVGVTISRQQVNRVVPALLRKMDGDVIDIGGYDDRLKRRYKRGKITNLDIAPGRAVDLVMDAGNMVGIDSGSLGGVFCISVLEHAQNAEAIVAEIHRVLKPGGTAYISTPWLFEAHMEPQDFLRFSSHWWAKRLAGFEVLEVHYSNSLFGCVAHFMQHSLVLRCTLGPLLFLADLACKADARFANQIGYVVRKP